MAKAPKIIPDTDLRQNAASVLKRVRHSKQPVVITQRGRAAAVMLSPAAYERVEIRKHGDEFTSGRSGRAEAQEDDGEPLNEKVKRLTKKPQEQFAELERQDQAIRGSLDILGYGIDRETKR